MKISREIELFIFDFQLYTFSFYQVFYVILTSATGGARVGDEGRAEIRIPANDKPYGTVVSMNETEVSTTEETTDSVVTLPLRRT